MNSPHLGRSRSCRVPERALERVLGVVAVLYMAAAAGCGGATDSEAGKGGQAGAAAGGVGGSGSGGVSAAGAGRAFEPTCLELSRLSTSCTQQTPVELLTAASLGQNARFRALGGLAALVEPPPAAPRVVTLRVPLEEQTVAVLDVQSDTAREVTFSGVWSSEALGARTVVLGCDGAGCGLFGAAGDSNLVHLEGAELPASAQVSGLAAGIIPREDTISLVETLCAYGEGLYCFGASGWREVLPAVISGTLTHVAIGRPSVAVSKVGELFVDNSGAWTRHALPFGEVTSLVTELGFVAATSPEGVYYLRATPPITDSAFFSVLGPLECGIRRAGAPVPAVL